MRTEGECNLALLLGHSHEMVATSGVTGSELSGYLHCEWSRRKPLNIILVPVEGCRPQMVEGVTHGLK